MKLQYKHSLRPAHALPLLLCVGTLLLLWAQMAGGAVLQRLVFSQGTDRYMDFFNCMVEAADLHIYESAGSIYPPLANLIYYAMGKLVPPGTSAMDLRASTAGMLLYVVFSWILLGALALLTAHVVGGTRLRRLAAGVLCLATAPVVFALERGNLVLLAVVLSFAFLQWYRSENAVLRELAVLSLALAANLKIYPAVLGLLLLCDKRWKLAARCVLYATGLFFVPFLFMGGRSALLALFGSLAFTDGKFAVAGLGYKIDFGNAVAMLAGLLGNTAPLWQTAGAQLGWVVLAVGVCTLPFVHSHWRRAALLCACIAGVQGFSYQYNLCYLLPAAALFFAQECPVQGGDGKRVARRADVGATARTDGAAITGVGATARTDGAACADSAAATGVGVAARTDGAACTDSAAATDVGATARTDGAACTDSAATVASIAKATTCADGIAAIFDAANAPLTASTASIDGTKAATVNNREATADLAPSRTASSRTALLTLWYALLLGGCFVPLPFATGAALAALPGLYQVSPTAFVSGVSLLLLALTLAAHGLHDAQHVLRNTKAAHEASAFHGTGAPHKLTRRSNNFIDKTLCHAMLIVPAAALLFVCISTAWRAHVFAVGYEAQTLFAVRQVLSDVNTTPQRVVLSVPHSAMAYRALGATPDAQAPSVPASAQFNSSYYVYEPLRVALATGKDAVLAPEMYRHWRLATQAEQGDGFASMFTDVAHTNETALLQRAPETDVHTLLLAAQGERIFLAYLRADGTPCLASFPDTREWQGAPPDTAPDAFLAQAIATGYDLVTSRALLTDGVPQGYVAVQEAGALVLLRKLAANTTVGNTYSV